jgi:anti-sigma factor RsiW
MMQALDAMTERDEARLHAYHDGELSALARWRFERELLRRPALRGELAALRAMRGALQDLDGTAAAPDLWASVATRLPRSAVREPQRERKREGRGAIWWLAPIGAAAATAAIVLAVVYGGLFATPAERGGSVRWIDSEDQNVMVLDDDPDTTIIWVLDGATDGASRGGPSDVV